MPEAPPEALDEKNADSLRRYLLSFDWPGRNAAIEEMIVAGGLPLWQEILRLVPAPHERAKLLELGSPPFHTTLLVQKFRNYAISPTAGVLDGRSRFTQRIESRSFAESHELDCRCLDLERDTFPFPPESFDAVLFCEVIEHLTENPVATLSEIHRVLRPGGALVLSTPNAASSGHVMRLWLGVNVFDQYHLGSPLRGTRHSHEYTLRELRDLVGGCGFEIERAYGRNLGQIQYSKRTRKLEPFFRLLTALAPGEHSDHLFLLARKRGPFRWRYPRELFDEGHLASYLDVRAERVVVGENDVPHTTGAWGPLVEVAGSPSRRIGEDVASVFLLAGPGGARRVQVALAGGDRAGRVSGVASSEDEVLGEAAIDLAPGAPAALEIGLRRELAAGERLRLDLRASPEANVSSVTLDTA